MKRTILYLLLAVAAATACPAQMLDLKHLDRLADKTDQVVNITLDEGLIRLAASFLKSNDPDLAEIRKILPGIRGIYVRSFEFDTEGVYSQGDVDKITDQLKGWSTVVEVREGRKRETTKVMIKMNDRATGGLVLLNSGPRELTVVNIAGTVTVEQLEKLGGHLGIPEIDIKRRSGEGSSKKKYRDEEEE
jgi:hypothetical protein